MLCNYAMYVICTNVHRLLGIPAVCRQRLHQKETRSHHTQCPRSHSSTPPHDPHMRLSHPPVWCLHSGMTLNGKGEDVSLNLYKAYSERATCTNFIITIKPVHYDYRYAYCLMTCWQIATDNCTEVTWTSKSTLERTTLSLHNIYIRAKIGWGLSPASKRLMSKEASNMYIAACNN